MSGRIVSLSVRPRGKPVKKLPEETAIGLEESTTSLYNKLAGQAGISVHRLRITKGSDGSLVSSSKNISVGDTGLRDQSTIYVKDLGPQIAWRTVFVVEYLGPILIHPLIYFLRPWIYRTSEPPSELQTVALGLVIAHFLKREFETLFVHRFSLATMPLRNIFKNSFHYWFFSGINLAYWIYSPTSPTAANLTTLTYPAIALFTFCELANLSTHFALRRLRSSGGTERGIPQGFGFDLVTCPNYMFEVFAWLSFTVITRSWSSALFAAVSGGQMVLWAKKKEKRYRSEFGPRYKKKRYTIIPGII